MIQATTPTILITMPASVDLTEASDIFVTLTQPKRAVLTFDTGRFTLIDEHTISLQLEQTETLSFRPGEPIQLQVNWFDADGNRYATKIATLELGNNLLPCEIPQSGQR